MKFAIEGAHRQFFRKHQALEIEGMLTEAQLTELNLQIEKTLEERLNTKPKRAFQELPNHIFSYGRDLFRSNDSLKKIILSKQLAEIASELIGFRPLRFGFDQLYCTVPTIHESKEGFNPFKELALEQKTLQEVSCIQGLLCGLMICLSGNAGEVEEVLAEGETKSIFAKKPGNAVFFSPEMPLDFSKLITDDTHRYLLITYTHSTSIYYLEENDPQAHVAKSLGYVFGDRLNDKLNPIIYR